MSTTRDELLDDRAHRARRVLDREPRARLERAARSSSRRAPRARARPWAAGRIGEHVAARDVEVVGEPDRHGHRRDRRLERPVDGLDRLDARAEPGRQHDDLVAGAPDAARDLAARSRGSRGARRTSAGSPTARGSGGSSRSRSEAISTDSRCSSSGGPSYQGMFSERSTTLSPCSAEIGITARSGEPELLELAAISSYRSCDQSTRSILLMATTTCGTREDRRMYACRRVCSTTPCRASTSTIRDSAVEAPVTMLRVYWTWPGASASWKRRRGVTNER